MPITVRDDEMLEALSETIKPLEVRAPDGRVLGEFIPAQRPGLSFPEFGITDEELDRRFSEGDEKDGEEERGGEEREGRDYDGLRAPAQASPGGAGEGFARAGGRGNRGRSKLGHGRSTVTKRPRLR